jgi:LPS export ABC transporter permease LptF/LPS export ABC transporter permease LptG
MAVLAMTGRNPFRLSIIDRYIIREVLPPTGLGLLVFTFILLLQQIALLASVLISRGADLATTLRLFLNLLPSIFAITLPMAFLLGVLLAFGRLASESEVVAMRASGISPAQMLRPVMVLSVVTGLITFYIMAVALPKANTTYRETFYTLMVSRARAELKPRVFTDDLVPQMVLYVSDIASDTGDWKDVFISDTRTPHQPKIMLARSGRLVIKEKEKQVAFHLEKGVIYTHDPQHPEVDQRNNFAWGEFPLPFEQIFPKVPLLKGDREMTLGELLDRVKELTARGQTLEAGRFWVEFHKKFSIPFACVVFGLLGLGLSMGSRKEARSAAFGLSIGIIAVYYVFLRLGEQAGDTGVMSPFLGMWGANIVLGGLAVGLLVLSQRQPAFDPLDPVHYASWIPSVRRQSGKPTLPGAARTPVPPRVVVRVPRAALRVSGLLPTILDRYVARYYLGFATLVITGFWAIFFLFHFMDLFDDIQQNHVKGKVVLHYYAFYAPEILHMVMPVAVLVATLTTFGVLTRRNEITAMKAGGISVFRATLPVITLSVLGSLGLFAMGEYVLPHTSRIAARDFNEIKGRPPQSTNYLERRWIMGKDGRIYNYDYMSHGMSGARPSVGAGNAAAAEVTLNGLSLFDLDTRAWALKQRLYAARARWTGHEYELQEGWRWHFDATPRFERLNGVATREVEDPSFFQTEDQHLEGMRFAQLRDHIASLEARGVDVARLRVQLHRKLAFPTVALVMTLLGIRFSFTVGRRGTLFGMAVSIVIAIVYWACFMLFEAMGNNAVLPAPVAAWAPNLLFGATGIYLMLTVDT